MMKILASAGMPATPSLKDALPADLETVIGQKGQRYRDDLTKATVYCAKKLAGAVAVPADRLGVICATAYGNFKSGCGLNEAAAASPAPLSAQIFPNATYSSAAVTASLELGARGLNLTLTAGVVGVAAALELAGNYLAAGRIDGCILIAGDDFAGFTKRNAEERRRGPVAALSTVAGLALGLAGGAVGAPVVTLALTGRRDVVIEQITRALGEGWAGSRLVHVAGDFELPPGPCPHVVRGPSPAEAYLGPALALAQITECLARLRTGPELLEGAVVLTGDADGTLGAIIIEAESA